MCGVQRIRKLSLVRGDGLDEVTHFLLERALFLLCSIEQGSVESPGRRKGLVFIQPERGPRTQPITRRKAAQRLLSFRFIRDVPRSNQPIVDVIQRVELEVDDVYRSEIFVSRVADEFEYSSCHMTSFLFD